MSSHRASHTGALQVLSLDPGRLGASALPSLTESAMRTLAGHSPATQTLGSWTAGRSALKVVIKR